MEIFLIRHGETVGNATRTIQKPDSPLSSRGMDQAKAVARRLADQNIVQIVASDFPRARMTAEEIGRSTNAPILFEPLLQERSFGDLRGTPFKDIDFDIFMDGYAPPGGETWEEFHARIDRAWARVLDISASQSGNLAVVTHALVCRSLVSRHIALPMGAAVPERWENTSVTSIRRSPPHTTGLLNCAIHLDESGSGSLV